MRNILVTGGAGYIGSHACWLLRQSGYQPVTLDNLQRGHRQLVRFGPLEEADLLDAPSVEAVFQRYQFGGILHFASLALVGESVAQPLLYYRNNFVGSLNLLECALRHRVHNLVFSSTCATYGMPQTTNLREDHPQLPINPYGETKLAVERLLHDVAHSSPLKVTCLRYFNAAGSLWEQGLGEWHEPETHLIPCAILSALADQPVAIFGQDYPTEDGTCVRDYVHVADLAQAHLLALQRNSCNLEQRGRFEAYNLGSETGSSVRQVVQAVETALGRRLAICHQSRRPGDPPRLVADSRAAQRDLKWNPGQSGLDQIVQSALRWHQSDIIDRYSSGREGMAKGLGN